MKMSILRTLLRWARSSSQRRYELQFSPHYWRLLQRWQAIRFGFGKRLFTASGWARSQRESFSILRSIFETIFGQVLLAIALVSALAGLDLLIAQFAAEMPSLDQVASRSVLSVVAQVAGIFLALYFTAVSVVASTAYAQVQSDIRDLLTREKIGNLYIRIVALTVAVAILLLTKNALGFSLGILDLSVVALLAVIAVFSFVLLGMRAFHFFDPTKLVEYLGYELVRWFQAATPKGFQWQNPSFQAHYQKQAEGVLMTYRNVVYLATQEKYFDGKALVQLILQPLILLQLYVKKKRSIPSESHWFKRIYRHRDWLTADYTEISMALRSGTSLQPEAAPDFMWFETYVEEVVANTFGALLKRQDLQNAVALLDNVQRTQSVLAEHLATDEALRLFRKLQPQVRELAVGTDCNATSPENETENQLAKLALIDVYCMQLINILLGFSKSLRELNVESFANRISNLRWPRARSIYLTQLPRAVVQQLEYLQKGLEFERAVEGIIVSPLWYQEQIAALGLMRFVADTVEGLVSEWEGTFGNQTGALVSEKRYLTATQVVQRGLEACDKFAYHLGAVRSYFEEFTRLRRVEDIPWPTPDWETFSKRVLSVREQLIVNLAKSSITLARMPSKPNWPDYFGQCFSVLAEECNTAMATGNEALFQQIFPSFFNAALAAHDRLRTQYGDRKDQAATVFTTESIEDLLHLSGYALIYTELDGKKYWDVVRKVWDYYLANHEDAKSAIEVICAIVDYRLSVFAILPRDPLRTAWKQKLEQRLRVDGILDEDSHYDPFGERAIAARHPSKIIQILARGGSIGTIFHNPHDIFLALYIAECPETSELRLPRLAQEFLDSLQRLEHTNVEEDPL